MASGVRRQAPMAPPVQTTLEGLIEQIRGFSPPDYKNIDHLNILLVGPVGAGKSSYVNTVCSVFKGRLSSPAYCGSAQQSLTTEYRTYTVRDEGSGKLLSFRLCDTRGLEESEELDIKELEYLLEGHIQDGYQHCSISKREKKKKTKLHMMKRLVRAAATAEIPGFHNLPSEFHKIHCVCFVLDTSSIDVMPMGMANDIKEVQKIVCKKGIPQVFLITKIDLVGSGVSDDVSQIPKSEPLVNLVKNIHELFGVPRRFVLPVKNFENETELPTDASILALQALQTMLTYATDILSDRIDRGAVRSSKASVRRLTDREEVMRSSDSLE